MSDTNPKILEHFQNPRNIGSIENADGYARGENPVNGYITDIYIKIENERITVIKYKTFGCIVTVASASALSEIVKGKTLNEITNGQDPLVLLMNLMKRELGDIPEKNWHCSPTAIQVLLSAISNYYRKNKDEKKVEKIEKTLVDIKSYFKIRDEEQK